MASKVKTALLGQIWLVEPRGEFVGGDETDELRTALDEANKAGATRLLVDLAGVSYLNSTALGVLIAGHTSFTKRGAAIALCNVSDNIRNIFVITKLTLVFTIYESRDEALGHMG